MPDFVTYKPLTEVSYTPVTIKTHEITTNIDDILKQATKVPTLSAVSEDLQDNIPLFKWRTSGTETINYPLSTTLTTPTTLYNAPSSANANNVIQWALSKVGRPYVWGSKGKNDTFDCSGLVYAAYKANGINVPGSTAAWKKSGKQKIEKNSGRPGNVIILNTNGPSGGHAMLITNNRGNGKYDVVEAKGKKYGVVTSTYTVGNNLLGIYAAKKGLKLIKKSKYE